MTFVMGSSLAVDEKGRRRSPDADGILVARGWFVCKGMAVEYIMPKVRTVKNVPLDQVVVEHDLSLDFLVDLDDQTE
jgi:hypothetical protein